jgi:phage tail-like protein
MAVFRDRPYLNGNFQVDLGTGDVDSVRGGFFEVVLPCAAVDIVEYRQGNEKTNEPRKLAGAVSYDDLVLRRGVLGSLDLYEWWNQARNGDANARRTVFVRLLNEDRTEVVVTWKFVNALPAKYCSPRLSATGTDVAIEELVLAFERLEVE